MITQARCPSSVTGGGLRKRERQNIWGAPVNLSLKFGSEDQKKKKGLHSKLRLEDTRAICLLSEHVHSLAKSLASSHLHSCFLSWNETLLTLGGGLQKQCFGGMHSSGIGPLLYFGGHISHLGGHGLEMCPRGAGL